MRYFHLLALIALGGAIALMGCSSPSASSKSYGFRPTPPSIEGKIPLNGVPRQLNMVQQLIPKGRYGRWKHRSMNPRYITIHSTQNYTGSAWDHSRALSGGALRARNGWGYLTWHFTVDDSVAIQHVPLNERGEHADFDGPGNRYSIGIEMCEHRGNNLSETIDRTAKLTAYLMHKEKIPLNHVVPHYHWPRRGHSPANKNCPHFLMDKGKPGKKWRWFLGKVNAYYRAMQ